MTALPPSPFLTDSAVSVPFAADTAVAFDMPQAPDAAANQSSSSTGGLQETPAVDKGLKAAGVTDLLGSDISDVGEIFLFAKILCAQARLRPGTISPEAVRVAEEIADYEDVYYDPPPLFLQRAG